jgi:hypothetical protein
MRRPTPIQAIVKICPLHPAVDYGVSAMRTSWMVAAIFAVGLSTAAFADQGANSQCSSNAATHLQSCLDKAKGTTGKQACKDAARREQDKCGGTTQGTAATPK